MTDEAGALVAVDLVEVDAPLRTPHAAAHGVERRRRLVLVRAELADGSAGWGECSALAEPTYTAEHTAGAWLVLADHLVPAALAGHDAGVVGHPMATHGLEAALADARLRRRGRRLADDLAAGQAAPAAALPVTAVVGRHDDVDGLLATVAERIAAGVAMVKLKVGPRPGDLDGVAAVRSAWPGLRLAVDANGTLDGRAVSILASLDLVYLEQPFPADDLLAHAAAARRHEVPIALDESIGSVSDLETALALGAVGVLNVKPARLGGLRPALEVARRAGEEGLRSFVGGMVESGVGRAAALALAAQRWCDLPTDLGPSDRYLVEELTDPIVADAEGRVVVPTGPGIGVDVRPAALEAVTVTRRRFER